MLEAPKYRTKDDVEELGGFYWGADEQTWDENKAGNYLKSIYPNKADNTVSYVLNLYNTTDTAIKGKYGIRVNSLRIKYQETEGAEEVTYEADLGNTQYDIVELNIEPGKSVLYEFIAEDAEWFSLLENIRADYDNGIIYDYYYNQNVSVQEIMK